MQAGKILAELEENLEQFDEIDQLEILCANAHVRSTTGMDWDLRIAEKLKKLPACTQSHLRALGMLRN